MKTEEIPHLSTARLQPVRRDYRTGGKSNILTGGTLLSEGGASAVMQRAGAVAQPVAKAIGEQVAQGGVIGSDETSTRVAGRTWWQWVFRSVVGVYFRQ